MWQKKTTLTRDGSHATEIKSPLLKAEKNKLNTSKTHN